MSPHELHLLINWLRVALIFSVVFSNLFIFMYLFSPWYKSAVGRLLMFQSASLAAALDITLVFHFWPPGSLLEAFWIELIEFFTIGLATLGLCVMLAIYYRRGWRAKKNDEENISN